MSELSPFNDTVHIYFYEPLGNSEMLSFFNDQSLKIDNKDPKTFLTASDFHSESTNEVHIDILRLLLGPLVYYLKIIIGRPSID